MQGFSGNISPGTSTKSALYQTLEQPRANVQQAHHDLLTQEAVQDHMEEAGEEEEEKDVLAGAEVIDAFCVVVEGPYF